MLSGTVAQRTVQEDLDEAQAPPHTLAVDTPSSCPLADDVFLQRRSPEALRAIDGYDKIEKQSERPDDGAGVEVGVVVVLVEPSDADAADAELESLVVLALRDPDTVDVEDLEDTIDTCPRCRRLLESLQQESLPQHQIPDERGGHATIAATRFA
ncbi:hypothetical protein MMC22_003925 [Lobaria immixta]|nr:hypothetical protein [Lobaria immixta]